MHWIFLARFGKLAQNNHVLMKKIIVCLTAICFCFFAVPQAFAADEYWSETTQPSGVYVQFSGREFDFFTVHLPAGTQAEMQTASGWQALAIDDEQDPRSRISALYNWHADGPLLLRLSGTIPDMITADFMDTASLANTSWNHIASTALLSGANIVTRNDWGAEESWRYTPEETAVVKDVEQKNSDSSAASPSVRVQRCQEIQELYPDEFDMEHVQRTENGRQLRWPYQYSKKKRKVVIHHTAETGVSKGRNADEVMRAIYRYHTVSRGWGDIGYHYVIAPDGTIFEGRAGGMGVVGGHVYCNNIGTIGVALMGNFNEHDPTSPQIVALGKLLPRLAAEYELDLTAESWYHGKKTPNLLGHRDLGATACPGESLHAMLPDFRRMLEGSTEIRLARESSVDGKPTGALSVVKLRPGEEHDLKLSFTNTGNGTWTNNTWLFAHAGDNVDILPVAGARDYVAAKMKQKQVRPGESADFTVRLRAGYDGGVATVSLVPVVQNERVTNAETLQVIEVTPPDWQARFVSIKTQPIEPVTGKATSTSITLINNGSSIWDKDHIELLVGVPGTKIAEKFALDANTAPKKSAVFNGRLPAMLTPGDKLLEMRLLLDGKWLPVRFLEPFPVKLSNNRATPIGMNKKVVLVQEGSTYKEPIKFKNTGNTEWYQNDLELTVLHRREKWKLHPEQEVIAPGATATFPFEVEAKSRVQPYVFLLKDSTQILDRTPLIMLGLKRAPQRALSLVPNAQAATPTPTPQPEAKPPQTDTDQIRIKLSFPIDLSTVEVSSVSNFSVSDASGQLLLPARAESVQAVNQVGPLVEFRGQYYQAIRISPDADNGILELVNWSRHAAWDVNKRWNDNVFPGTLEIRVVDDTLTVINELPLEDYLLGLGETVETNHAEKKQAIAVVARSYARHYMDQRNRKYPGKPYDGSDDPAEFQKYLGANLTKRSPGWVKAVEATTGEVLTYNGKVIKTPFHTSSGGRTTSAADRWGWTDTPYFPSVDDPGCADKAPAGHGVGMSGCGSQHFAEQGWGYEEILEYFYPGVTVATN